MELKNNMPAIISLTGNMIVYAQQMYKLAQEQFANEHKAGSRSASRGLLLAEIGTELQGIVRTMAYIKERVDMLQEIPMNIDSNAVEEENYQIF